MTFIFQDWLSDLTWKEQTVLVLGMRDTDASGSKDVKSLTEWLRNVILNGGTPNTSFIKVTTFKGVLGIAQYYPMALDMLPVHFLVHLMHSFEVVGYRHPDPVMRIKAFTAYTDLCDFLHINPETEAEMTERLKDEV